MLQAAGHEGVGASSDPTQCVVESPQRQAEVTLQDLSDYSAQLRKPQNRSSRVANARRRAPG